MRIAFIYRTGLFTSPTGNMCGAATHINSLKLDLMAAGHSVDLFVEPWNGAVSKYVLGRCVGAMVKDDPYAGKADAPEPYDFTIDIGHSHGADASRMAAEGLPGNFEKPLDGGVVDVVGLIDDCPFLKPLDNAVSRLKPITPPLAAVRGCAFWQTNEEPSGLSVAERKGWVSTDVSNWESGNIGHIDGVRKSVAGHAGVWLQIQSVVFAGVAARMLQPFRNKSE